MTVNGALWAANVNNNGTLVNNGTVHDTLNNTGSVTNNAAYFANVNNTGAAAVINNTASGTWTGNLLSNTGGAIVNNAGTWNGDANNASTVNNTGTWTTASAGFTNSGTVRFFQLTNAFTSPLAIDRLGIDGREVARVWLNLLPTQIWAYSARSEWMPTEKPDDALGATACVSPDLNLGPASRHARLQGRTPARLFRYSAR